MCGRKTLTKGKKDIIEELLIDEWEDGFEFTPTFNAAPTHRHPVIVKKADSRLARPMYWGLIPEWARDRNVAAKLINARLETLDDKPAFRDLVDHRRCIIPADGYFEWKGRGKDKQPYFIYRQDMRIMAFAGLFTSWAVTPNQLLWTYTIITKPSEGPAADIHDRMPVILDAESTAMWLDIDNYSFETLKPDLEAGDSDLLTHTVHPMVNTVSNNRPDCIAYYEPTYTMSLFPGFDA